MPHSNFLVTPSKRFAMWLHTVFSMEHCLLLAKYIRATT